MSQRLIWRALRQIDEALSRKKPNVLNHLHVPMGDGAGLAVAGRRSRRAVEYRA